MLMKIIIFFENFLQGINLLCRENVFVATISVWIEEKKKNHNFLAHYQMGGRQPIEDKPLKKHILMKFCRDIALIFLNIVTIMIFITHEN